jgi:hypothetical protein
MNSSSIKETTLIDICKSFKIPPNDYIKLRQIFFVRPRAVSQWMEVKRPVMLLIIFNRILGLERVSSFITNLIWDGSETKSEKDQVSKIFRDESNKLNSICSQVDGSKPAILFRTMNLSYKLTRFLDPERLHKKEFISRHKIDISKMALEKIEENKIITDQLHEMFFKECGELHKILPINHSGNGISSIVTRRVDPISHMAHVLDDFKRTHILQLNCDSTLHMMDCYPLLTPIIISNKEEIKTHHSQDHITMISKIVDRHYERILGLASEFTTLIKIRLKKKIKILNFISDNMKIFIKKIRVKIKNKHKIAQGRRSFRPPKREGKYRISLIEYSVFYDWFIMRKYMAIRVKKCDDPIKFNENIIGEMTGFWDIILKSALWLFIDYIERRKLWTRLSDMRDYLTVKRIINLHGMMVEVGN